MPTIEVSALTPDRGFAIEGAAPGDMAGFSVSEAGDVNGDGFDDFIVGAPFGDRGGLDAGQAYVVFGREGGVFKQAPGGLALANLGSGGFVIQGDAADDRAGLSVSSAGDVDGDGFDDIIVGAPLGDDGGYEAGEAYVIFGKASGLAGATIDLSSLGTAGFVIRGDNPYDFTGWSVSSAGDVNGDGFDDVIIGSPFGDGGFNIGRAYVVFGKASGLAGATIDLTSLGTAGFAIYGDLAGDEAGYSVSAAGDINGDGFDDVIVGAPGWDGYWDTYGVQANAGKAYVIFGHAGGFSSLSLGSLGSSGFSIAAFFEEDAFGTAVSSAGDVNGDGFDDLVVGGPGGSRVFFGHAGPFSNIDDFYSFEGFSFRLSTGGVGFAVSTAGDVNGDGLDDLIVGSRDGDNAQGDAFVVYGQADWQAGGAGGSGMIIRNDGATGDGTGRSVTGIGDLNGDFLDDVLVGSASGDAWVIYGIVPTASMSRSGDALDNRIIAGTGDDRLDGLDGSDFLSGWDGDDQLLGGAGNDTIFAGRGDDLVEAGSGDDTVDGGDGDDIIAGGSGNDTLDGGLGYDMLTGGSGDDTITSASGNDNIDGGSGSDTLVGGSGNDTLYGREGNDGLSAGAGADAMIGGLGNDVYQVSSAGDQALERAGEGTDRVNCFLNSYTLAANIEQLKGMLATGQTLIGNALANTITAGAGDDRLEGGAGKDTLVGSAGRDTFVFRDGDAGTTRGSADRISDFDQGLGEKIRLREVDANTLAAGDQNFAWIGSGAFNGAAGQLRYAQAAGTTYLEGDTNGDGTADFAIALTGTLALSASDIVL